VTEAIHDYWQYFEPIRVYGPPDCISTQQKMIHIVDNILIGRKNEPKTVQKLKDAFGLGNLTYVQECSKSLKTGY
jgi:hypothetical protein